MHTFVWNKDDPDEVRIQHDGDFGGIVICSGPGIVETVNGVEIPADVLLAFAAEYIRAEKIRRLENAPTNKVLLGKE